MLDSIIAGDSYTIPLTFADYPATSGYVCKLALRGPVVLNATAVANGDDYTVTLPSATTALLAEGTYNYAVSVTLAGERVTVETGHVKVTGDISTTGAKVVALEARLNAIEAILTGKFTSDIESYSIAGRSITKIDPLVLMEIRAQTYRELAALTGKMPSRTIRVQLKGLR